MAQKSLSHGHFFDSERSPIGAVTLAGRHLDLPPIDTGPRRQLASFALVLVLAGRGQIENAAGANESAGPGDMMLIFPFVDYRYRSTEGDSWSEWWVHFEGPVFELWKTQGVITPRRPVIRAGSPRYWFRRLEAITAKGARAGSPSQLHRVGMLQQVLADAMDHDRQAQVAPADEAWLNAVLEAIEPRIGGERPDWRRISKKSGMTYDGFRKRFARLTGIAPARHYATRLLERACDLLHQPELTLADIADACGYCDQFQFSRQFQKHIGIAPGQYRKRFHVK